MLESKDTCDIKDEDNHSLGNYLLRDYWGRESPSTEYILAVFRGEKSPSTEYILVVFHHDHPNLRLIRWKCHLSLGIGNREPSLRKDTGQKQFRWTTGSTPSRNKRLD